MEAGATRGGLDLGRYCSLQAHISIAAASQTIIIFHMAFQWRQYFGEQHVPTQTHTKAAGSLHRPPLRAHGQGPSRVDALREAG